VSLAWALSVQFMSKVIVLHDSQTMALQSRENGQLYAKNRLIPKHRLINKHELMSIVRPDQLVCI
jgi:hypothetical protein